MALTAGTIFAMQSSATTGNTGGSGFNTANANFPTDLAATSANTSAPVVTSATYTFAAGDATTPPTYVYVKSGTHWQAGWYPIASVNAGAATLNASVGAVVLSIGAAGIVTLNTVAGCTSDATATLSSGTFGVDYSQCDTANSSPTNIACTTGAAVITSASNPWSSVSVGNLMHITAGTNFTPGWYEIVSYTSAGQVTLDRDPTGGINGTSGTGQTGGAGRLNGTGAGVGADAFQAMLPSAALVWIKNGSYSLAEAISTANTNPTAANPALWIGYNSIRGDACNGSNRPIIIAAANAVAFGQDQCLQNLSFTTTDAAGIKLGTNATAYNCKSLNTSTTASRVAFTCSANTLIACEAISQNGAAISSTTTVGFVHGCYVHDSLTGINNSNPAILTVLSGNIIEACKTAVAVETSTSVKSQFINNIFYGTETPVSGSIGLNFNVANGPEHTVLNNIFYGWATGITVVTNAVDTNNSYYNDFFNNTADNTRWTKGKTDLALNPTFTNVSQVAGTVGQGIAGSKVQDTTKNFTTLGVVANQDFLHITSGGSLTAGVYLITAITTTTNPNDTLTLNNNPGTGAASGVYFIPIGHNFQIGTNLKALGFPNFTNTTNGLTTSYPDVGAVQRQEPSGGAGGSFTFVG